MIHKVGYLKSIGKFRDYTATGDVAFNRMTLIFADNGSGKTTLSAILRSLTRNDPNLVVSRTSTHNTIAQSAQIVVRALTTDTHYTFGRGGWNYQLPDIEIFDSHFVDENIHSGFVFNDDQRKNLHQFVIGAAGVGVRQQIEQNKADKTTCRQSIEAVEQNILRSTGNGLTTSNLAAFIAITANQNTNVDAQIIAAERALESANANAVLRGLPLLARLPLLPENSESGSIIEDLASDTANVMEATLKGLFSDHCADLNENGVDSPENWLKTGFHYIEGKLSEQDAVTNIDCPFCQQQMGVSLPLLQAYTAKFDENFNSLIERISRYQQSIGSFNLQHRLNRLEEINQENITRILAWSTHIPAATIAPLIDILSYNMQLTNEYEALVMLLQRKGQNPSVALTSVDTSSFFLSIQTMNARITSYNAIVGDYNTIIEVFLRAILQPVQAQTEVSRLKRTKMRFDPAITGMISALRAEKAKLRALETAYTSLIATQQAAAATFFIRYQDRINHYLTNVFKTPFKIDRVEHIAPAGRATQSKLDYKITIHGVDISFDPNLPYSAKDCLSEGDKSTIALSFFLSKLDIDGGITNKIIVFDDPLSSFDRNRRFYTVQLLKDLLPKVKQLVVLSHNETFLHHLSKTTAASQKSILRIGEDFTTSAAFIERLDLTALLENDYFKHITELESFLRNPDMAKKEAVLGLMRNVLEANISFKFYRKISAIPPNSRTFGILITGITAPPAVTFRDNVNAIDVVNKLTLINGVSCKPHHGEGVPDYATLGMDPNSMTTTELANLVQDTLDLIDQRL